MATNSRRRQTYTPEERAEHVDQFRRSGFSQAEFCRRAKLNPMTFSLWRRKSAAMVPAFAEVQLAAPLPVSISTATLRLPNGARLDVPVGTEANWHGLGLLLKSLQA